MSAFVAHHPAQITRVVRMPMGQQDNRHCVSVATPGVQRDFQRLAIEERLLCRSTVPSENEWAAREFRPFSLSLWSRRRRELDRLHLENKKIHH